MLIVMPFLISTTGASIDTLKEEWENYVVLEDDDIPSIDDSSKPPRPLTMAQKWAKIGRLPDFVGHPKFQALSRAMLGILTIPHSNASCERVFSQVRQISFVFLYQVVC